MTQHEENLNCDISCMTIEQFKIFLKEINKNLILLTYPVWTIICLIIFYIMSLAFKTSKQHDRGIVRESPPFVIPTTYDYSRSTEENYMQHDHPLASDSCDPGSNFVGKYAVHRQLLDYEYHKMYCSERQRYHDELIDKFLDTVIIRDKVNRIVCDVPAENWIVFTAGPMGAGKSHTIQWLNKRKIFPLKAFVQVDPDRIRSLLPEIVEYIRRNSTTAGQLTQKEVGYISEVLTLEALRQGKNVLVDGSLRDFKWYQHYFKKVRTLYPKIKIGIIHVVAKIDTIMKRAHKRAKRTGRLVPEDVILDTFHQIDRSMELLTPFTNFVAAFENEEDREEPRLLYATERSIPSTSNSQDATESMDKCILADSDWQESFRSVWNMVCRLPSSLSYNNLKDL